MAYWSQGSLPPNLFHRPASSCTEQTGHILGLPALTSASLCPPLTCQLVALDGMTECLWNMCHCHCSSRAIKIEKIERIASAGIIGANVVPSLSLVSTLEQQVKQHCLKVTLLAIMDNRFFCSTWKCAQRWLMTMSATAFSPWSCAVRISSRSSPCAHATEPHEGVVRE